MGNRGSIYSIVPNPSIFVNIYESVVYVFYWISHSENINFIKNFLIYFIDCQLFKTLFIYTLNCIFNLIQKLHKIVFRVVTLSIIISISFLYMLIIFCIFTK